MLIVGELINSSRKSIHENLEKQNIDFILNPRENRLMGDLFAAQALLGQDSYCGKYLSAHRTGLYQE